MDITLKQHEARSIVIELSQGDNMSDKNLNEQDQGRVLRTCFELWNFHRAERETGKIDGSNWYPQFHADMVVEVLLEVADWKFFHDCLNDNILTCLTNDLKVLVGTRPIQNHKLHIYAGCEERLNESFHFEPDRVRYAEAEPVDDEIALEAWVHAQALAKEATELTARLDTLDLNYGEVRELTRDIKANLDAMRRFVGIL